MTGVKHRLRSDFVPEWCGIAALVALDAAWARAIDFHLTIALRDGLMLGLGLGIMLALRAARLRRGAVMAEYFALTLAATTAFAVLSYLCLASSSALVDDRLLAMDRAMRFDWMAGYRFLLENPWCAQILQLAYGSLVYQALYFCVLLALMERKRALREMFWLVFVAGLLTSAGALLFPALGPFKVFGTAPDDSFLPVMEHLIGGQDLNFALAQMTGVVSFPSFHTAMALAYTYGFRGTGVIGWGVAALNAVMLLAIPFFGGHYLMDMLAGAGVMLASLAIVKGFGGMRTSAGFAGATAQRMRSIPALGR